MAKDNGNNKPGYVGAPYNFVPFSEKIMPYKKADLPGHDESGEELISGEIKYQVTAKTEIMVDDGTGKFYKNINGKYAIPGSTMRGLIRNNAQILSLSSFDQDIDDYQLMYRDVAGKNNCLNYNRILGADTVPVQIGEKSSPLSILREVRAGYVCLEDGKYRIYDTDLDIVDLNQKDNTPHKMNYYILSERNISADYLKSKDNKNYKFSYPFFVNNKSGHDEFITLNLLDKGFHKQGEGNRTQYKGKENGKYKPFAKPCSYNVSGRNVIAVDAPGVLSKDGYAVATGKMQQKKAIYIIPKVDFGKKICFDEQMPIEISPEDLKSFQIDIKKRENTLKQFGGRKAFDLPDKEGRENAIPIFYIRKGKRLYFGFTPRLRLFYDKTVKKGLPRQQRESEFDFGRALFGYSVDDDAYKSRVSFSDLEMVRTGHCAEQKLYVLAEPKPTSYMDYLEKGRTYNDVFTLRGVKQYWLRDEEVPSNVSAGKEEEKFVSKFTPLDAGAVFEGKVRFHNLNADELGLLLWSMKLNPESMMNVGKAKAFGYGVIKLELLSSKYLDKGKAYTTESFCLDPYTDLQEDDYIDTFKKKVMEFLKVDDLNKNSTYRAFFLMKNFDRKPDSKKIRFMQLGDKDSGRKNEYQNRTPLDTVDKIMGAKYNTGESKVQSDTEMESSSVAIPASEPEPARVMKEYEVGKTYEGVISEVKQKNIKIHVEQEYPVYKIDEFKELAKMDDLNKKNAPSLLKDKKVILQYHGDMDDHKGWSFVKFSE